VVVKELDDPGAFLEAARPLLLEDEARNNLVFGIAGTLRDHPSLYDEYRLWIVEDGDRTVGVALRTPPYNLALGGPARLVVAKGLAESLYAAGIELPGVTGAAPEVEHFATAWETLARVARRQRMAQRIYRLTALRPVEDVSGRGRPATEEDRPLLLEWVRSFVAEAIPEGTPDLGPERTVDARLGESRGGFTIWEDGGPVSIAGWGGTTPNGVRIGPVYTPPEYRRRGYGRAVTAAVSAERLASGRTFCFLYTDLANPTSNKIYTDIGYEPVCDSIDYAFERASG
jgi:predicted GNAT family acetyltransferase